MTFATSCSGCGSSCATEVVASPLCGCCGLNGGAIRSIATHRYDAFDEDLPERVAEGNESLQALEDAIIVRELLFTTLRDVSSARFHVYRESGDAPRELIIAGTVTRSERFCTMFTRSQCAPSYAVSNFS